MSRIAQEYHRNTSQVHTTVPPFIFTFVTLLMLFMLFMPPLGNIAVLDQLLGDCAGAVGLEITSISFRALSTVFPKPIGGKKRPSTVPVRISLREGSLRSSLPNRVG